MGSAGAALGDGKTSFLAGGAWQKPVDPDPGVAINEVYCTLSRISAGIVQVELDQPVDESEMICAGITQREGASPIDAFVTVQHVSGTLKRITWHTAGAGVVDISFDFTFFRIAPRAA